MDNLTNYLSTIWRSALEAAGPGLVRQYDDHARLCAWLQVQGETPEGNVA
ncbi:hypothetical protein [Jeongeupia sp. HS-3]|nr:hypothetical protein [Jeongeupia sp. HS-3]